MVSFKSDKAVPFPFLFNYPQIQNSQYELIWLLCCKEWVWLSYIFFKSYMRRRINLKEYIVCYTLENEIKQERILKEQEVMRKEVFQEVLEKILNQNTFMAKSDQGDYWINSSSVRYVRVI